MRWQQLLRHKFKIRMRTYKGYIKDDQNFRILFQTSVMLVGHVFETAYCYNKLTTEEFAIFLFDSHPTCALIGKNNDWCLVGGEDLVLSTWADNTLRVIGDIKQIFDLKAIEGYTVEILTDPWTDLSAIWRLEINLRKLTRPTSLFRIRDFKDYIGKPYSEQVVW
jgi:hypothetical protein